MRFTHKDSDCTIAHLNQTQDLQRIMAITTHLLGYPRIGARRELKFALEGFWQQQQSAEQLHDVAAQLRAEHWQQQHELTWQTVGDFALYDHVLTLTQALGNIPARFSHLEGLAQYFALARGTQDAPALEMRKWFDTNYHYLVPELSVDSHFSAGELPLFAELTQARLAGHRAKPVLLGPISYLWLGKSKGNFERLSLLPELLAVYQQWLTRLQQFGCDWVQLDEPVLSLDLPIAWQQALASAYQQLAAASPKILLATYFGSVATQLPWLCQLPLGGIHLDVVRAPEQLKVVQQAWPADKVLSLGVIDGRNVWKTDLNLCLTQLQALFAQLGERLWLSASCSLLHVPCDLNQEQQLAPEIAAWLAFARQKVTELHQLAQGLDEGISSIADAFAANAAALASRRQSARIHRPEVAARVAAITPQHASRAPFATRQAAQHDRLALPLLPTTTIGSFPQTAAIRRARAAYKQGILSTSDYQQAMQTAIAEAVTVQEHLGLDVLVHGEAERNDMVEYFGEQLAGFAFTQAGWVQSYGSRCVKPPIIYGDVFRPAPMTVAWFQYAQSLTARPMKGMLTGPVTLLQWSFVRDDQARATTALQLALAIRDEVRDLEAAGCAVIQIDEPAFREGLPLATAQWEAYLAWAVQAFRVASSGVDVGTQIHTHMCYSEFEDILPAIAALDADVITIETARSDMSLLDGFARFAYPNQIGPGVYDIHSPSVPTVAMLSQRLEKALQVIPAARLWVNPDCGLKTRAWPETKAALTAMVTATLQCRAQQMAMVTHKK